MDYTIITLSSTDLELMDRLLNLFGEVFDQVEIYGKSRPDNAYMQQLLGGDSFIAVAALKDQHVIGGLAAYELKKFEQMRSEIYLYDLAVAKEYRRHAIATALIEHLKRIAKQRGAWVIFVQADYVDEAAVKLYSKLGIREDVLHFDIPIAKQEKSS